MTSSLTTPYHNGLASRPKECKKICKMAKANEKSDVYELNSKMQDGMKKNSKQEDNSMTAKMKSVEGAEKPASGNEENEYKPSEKWRIIKNIVVISAAFMVHFTAFQGAGNLQSSVNADEGLGTVSLATIYFSLILSNVFLPVVMIRLVVNMSVFISGAGARALLTTNRCLI